MATIASSGAPPPTRPRPPRATLTRGKGVRTMPLSGDVDSSRHLINHHHKSLAKLAGQSIRHMNYIRQNSADRSNPLASSPLKNAKEENASDDGDYNESYSELQEVQWTPPPIQREDTLGMDDVSLDVLCKHVSELMGGEPMSPANMYPGPPLSDSGAVPQDALGAIPNTFLEDYEGGDIGSVTSSFRLSAVDIDSQIAEMQRFEKQKQETDTANIPAPPPSESTIPPTLNNNNAKEEEPDSNMIEVSPGEFMPLLASTHTFKCILTGQIAVAKCFGCMEELTVSTDADLVICSDCWIFSPVEPDKDDGPGTYEEESKNRVVGMGVKAREMIQWLGEEGNLS